LKESYKKKFTFEIDQPATSTFVGLAYKGEGEGEDIMFRFIIEYSSLTDFGP
jgi:hypothetical protein